MQSHSKLNLYDPCPKKTLGLEFQFNLIWHKVASMATGSFFFSFFPVKLHCSLNRESAVNVVQFGKPVIQIADELKTATGKARILLDLLLLLLIII